jgi:hypothetical protein
MAAARHGPFHTCRHVVRHGRRQLRRGLNPRRPPVATGRTSMVPLGGSRAASSIITM